jgi:hypothetical protein
MAHSAVGMHENGGVARAEMRVNGKGVVQGLQVLALSRRCAAPGNADTVNVNQINVVGGGYEDVPVVDVAVPVESCVVKSGNDTG